MSDNLNSITSLIIRYVIIVVLGIANFYLIYKLLTPLTINFSAFILSLFGETLVIENYILFNLKAIDLVPACIAGSAYYLLLALNLSTKNVKIKTRIYALVFSVVFFFLINSLRIVGFSLISPPLFEALHLLFWYFLSILFVVGIWFLTVYLFKINSIPVYDDLIFLVDHVKDSKRPKKNNNPSKKNTKRN